MTKIVQNTARKILEELYSANFQLHPLQSATSDVFLTEFHDGSEPVLIKIPRATNEEAIREQRVVDALESIHIPVPPVLCTQENKPVGSLVYTVFRYIRGPSIREVVAWNDERTQRTFAQIGELALQLSRVSPAMVPEALTAEEVQAQELQWWEDHNPWIARHRGTTRLLEYIWHAARGILLVPPTVFGHRDGVQVVSDGARVHLIDAGSAGANWPDADYARLIYGGYAWYGGEEHKVWREATQQAYFEGRTPTDADVERILILMAFYAIREAAIYSSTDRNRHVDYMYHLAEMFLVEGKKWFGR